MKATTIRPSIKKNFAYKSTLTISTYLINFFVFPYISRVLGVEKVGLVGFVDNTVNYFILFATMGVSLLGVREIAIVKDDIKKRSRVFSNIIGLNLLFTFATLIVYLLLIVTIPKLHQYSELFYIGSAKILFTVFLIEWFFTGIENFRYITIRSLLIKLLYVLAIFIFIQDSEDYKLYFVMTVGVIVLNAIININYVRRFVAFRFSDIFNRKYFKQNFSLGIYSIMTSMYLTFNVMFLGLVTDNVQVGYYTTAFKLYSVLLGLFTAFTNVMLPRMSALLAEGNNENFQKLVNKSFSVIFMLCIPVISYGSIFAPQIIEILSGAGYEGAIIPMRIIMPALLLVGIAQVLAIQVLIPMKKDNILLTASIIGASVSLAINIMIVPHFQSIGTAIVLLCAELVVTATYIAYALKERLVIFPISILIRTFLFGIPIFLLLLSCYILIKDTIWMLVVAAIMTAFFCYISMIYNNKIKVS